MSKQLSLSLKRPHRRQKTEGNAFTSKILRELQPGELFSANILLPCGFTNPANLCYATSTFQCLFNHPVYSVFFERISGLHTLGCDDKCAKGQLNCACMGNQYINKSLRQFNCFVFEGSVCSIKAVKSIYDHYHYAEDGEHTSAFPLVKCLKDTSTLTCGEQCDAHEFYLWFSKAIQDKLPPL